MSKPLAPLAVIVAAALLSLPAALAADYSVTGDVVINDIHYKKEVDIKGIHYKGGIHDKKMIDVHLESKKVIDVHIDVDPVATVPVVTDQSLIGEEHQLNGMDFINIVPLAVDGDTAQGDPDGTNEQSGEDNIQENKSVLVPDADSLLRQNLTGNSFNTDPADGPNPVMHNAIDFSLTATGDITQDVLVNAAAGAFNLQANSSVIEAGIGLLAQATADAQQESLLNGSVVQDATNEVMSTISLEDVSANIGINLVAGVGNEQINTFTATTTFAP